MASSKYADLQAKNAAIKAREDAYKKATSVESRAAVARAARGLAPRDPSKPAYTMDDYRRDFPSKRPAPPNAAMPAIPSAPPDLPSPGRGAPISPRPSLGGMMAGRNTGLASVPPMGGMDNMQMIKKGGMTKKSGRDGCAIRGKTRA